MTALELRNRLENALDMMIPATAIWRTPTSSALAAYLADRLPAARPDAAPDDDEAILSRILEEVARPD
jgi:polyketide synthase 12